MHGQRLLSAYCSCSHHIDSWSDCIKSYTRCSVSLQKNEGRIKRDNHTCFYRRYIPRINYNAPNMFGFIIMTPLIRIILSIMIAVLVSVFIRTVFEVSYIISITTGAFFGGMSVTFLKRITITKNYYGKILFVRNVLAIVGGLIAMASGVILVIFVWKREFYKLVFGIIPIVLFFSGIIALKTGINDILAALKAKKLEEKA